MLLLKSLINDWSVDLASHKNEIQISAFQKCLYFHCAPEFYHSTTRTYVRLLGPCFKTGRIAPFCQNREYALSRTSLISSSKPKHNFVVNKPMSNREKARQAKRGAYCALPNPFHSIAMMSIKQEFQAQGKVRNTFQHSFSYGTNWLWPVLGDRTHQQQTC